MLGCEIVKTSSVQLLGDVCKELTAELSLNCKEVLKMEMCFCELLVTQLHISSLCDGLYKFLICTVTLIHFINFI